MEQNEMFKRLVDRVFWHWKNKGKPLTMDDMADKLDYTREHFSRLYHMKYPISKKHINKLLLTFPEVRELSFR